LRRGSLRGITNDLELGASLRRHVGIVKNLLGDVFGEIILLTILADLSRDIADDHDAGAALQAYMYMARLGSAVSTDDAIHGCFLVSKSSDHNAGSGS
jgi:hypothetical protein